MNTPKSIKHVIKILWIIFFLQLTVGVINSFRFSSFNVLLVIPVAATLFLQYLLITKVNDGSDLRIFFAVLTIFAIIGLIYSIFLKTSEQTNIVGIILGILISLLNILVFFLLLSKESALWFAMKKVEGVRSANKELFAVLFITGLISFLIYQNYYVSHQSQKNLKVIAEADRVSDSIERVKSESAKETPLTVELITTALDINKTCPIKYDNGMRLDSVKANTFDTSFIFFYSDNNFSVTEYDRKKLKENLYKIKREELKQDSSLNYLRNHNVKIVQNYFDKNGIFVCKLNFVKY